MTERKPLTRLGRFPVAGLLVSLIAMLTLWRGNLNRLPVESAWPTIASVVVLAAASVLVLRVVTGSWVRAGLGSGLLALYVFYVPAIFELADLPRWAAIIAHLIVIAVLVMIARRIPKDPDRAVPLAGKLNAVGLLLFILTAVPMAVTLVGAERVRARAQLSLGTLGGQSRANSPDVWHILFDRYAGRDTFRSAYGYDNGPFIAALRARGFTVQDSAFSNYQRTGHSVASTMNGALLDPLAAAMAEQPADWVPIYRSMRDSAAIRTFNAMGYRTVFAGSWWEPTRFSTIADESLKFRAIPQLARLAIDGSAIGFWTRGLPLPFVDGRQDQCLRASDKFRRLRALAGSRARKHVFAHFLVPHPPFVLNADGSCRTLDQAQRAGRRDNYLAQVAFANREVLALIDAITAGPRKAVIVLHSDEGPWPAPFVGDEHGLGTDPVPVPWARLTPQQLRDKTSILLAVRGPDGPPRTMPSSPVQIYPAILRDHFGSTAALPESKHFVFDGDNALYRFIPVDDKLAP